MPVDSAANLIDALRRHRLLGLSQLDELARGHFADPRCLARALIERDWLTPYQVNQVMQGHGGDLVLGQYVLLQRLNENALGQVYKARHQAMRRLVALTMVRENLLSQPEAVARFYEEIQTASRLNHPHIVCAFDAGPIRQSHFFAQEYVEGISLDEWVQRSGPLPTGSAARFIRQVALGMDHAWQRRLLHHDLKPANLLVTRLAGSPGPAEQTPRPSSELFSEAHVKIGNLGLTLLRPQARGGLSGNSSLVLPAVSADSLDFWPPEQLPGSVLADVRSNLYSLGCIYYYLLAGRVPFPSGGASAKLRQHQEVEPTALQALRPDLPPETIAVVRALMAKRPEDRYQSPADLIAALPAPSGSDVLTDTWLTNRPASEPTATPTVSELPSKSLTDPGTDVLPVETVAPRRGRKWFLAGGLVAVVGIGVGAWIGLSPPATPFTTEMPTIDKRATPDTPPVPLGFSYQKRATRDETILATLKLNGLPNLEGKWYFIGPFDNGDKRGFATVYPPEKEIDLRASYKGKDGQTLTWKELPNFHVGRPYDLRLFGNNDWTCVYLYHEMTSADAAAMTLSLGSDDTLTAWLNGEKIVAQDIYRAVAPDQARPTLRLRPGANPLLLKVCNGGGDFAFYAKPEWPAQLEASFGAALRRDFPSR